MPIETPIKIGIFFWGCNNLDKRAFQYLLLSLNKNQTSFEFEIHDHRVFDKGPKGRKLSGLGLDPESDLGRQLITTLQEYDQEVGEIISDPENELPSSCFAMPRYKIVVVEREVKNEFYSYYDGKQGLGIIAIRAWRKKFAPPSVLEFLLSTVIATAIDLVSSSVENDVDWNPHIATRGCIGDFNDRVENARNSVLINNICNSCEIKMKSIFGENSLIEIKAILSNDWFGDPNKYGTIAYNLKRCFSYDLLKTKGLKASRLEILTQKFSEAFAENMAKAVLAALIIFLLGVAGILAWRELFLIITN